MMCWKRVSEERCQRKDVRGKMQERYQRKDAREISEERYQRQKISKITVKRYLDIHENVCLKTHTGIEVSENVRHE